jgi:inner membrane protein YhjD
VAVVKKYGDDRAGNLAALVAYYAFFSLFPLLLALVTILGFVLRGHSQLAVSIQEAAFERIPPPLDKEIQAGTLRGSGIGLAIGLAVALWAGQGAMGAAQDALHAVWDIPRYERPNAIARRVRSFLALGVIGVLLVASAVASQLAAVLPGSLLSSLGLLAVTTAITAATFLCSFQILTVPRQRLQAHLPGAVIAGTAFVGLQQFGRWYVQRTMRGAAGTYGTFATVIGLLSWLYLMAQITIVAVEVNSVLSRHLWPRRLVGHQMTDGDRRANEAELREAGALPAGPTVGATEPFGSSETTAAVSSIASPPANV